jgi:ubiquinone biosynthesis protein
MGFVNAVKNFSRMREVANVLFKEGLGEVVERLGFKTHLTIEKRMQKGAFKKVKTSHLAVRLRRAMENAGGAYVKLGQMLSLRSDLIPENYCDEFAKLQDHVKPISYNTVKKVVEAEFGKGIERVFKTFEKTPLAAASIAQVHKATLRDGRVVAVKVQRPKVAKSFKSDIEILYYIAAQAEKYMPEIRPFKPTRIVKEFESYTKNELDFLQEAQNIEQFHKKYKYSQHIKIPQVYRDYTTSRVLTMSFLDGKKISELRRVKKEKKKKIALTVYNSFLTQVFDMRTFHADPHPGNVLLMKNGKVAFLDFGIVGKMSPELERNVEGMLIALVKGDLDMLAHSFIDLGIVEDINIEQFKEDLFNTWGKYHNVSNNQINMKKFFAESFALARKYKIEYPGNFVLLAKTIITVQALGEKLYPESNFIEIVSPKVERILKKRHSPKRIIKSARKNFFNLAWTFRKFPQDLRSLMHIVKTGARVKVDIENKDIKYFTQEMDRSSNRITYGLIIGSLTITAGLIILAKAGPIYAGIPFLAWIVVGLVVLLSLTLAYSIINENKRGGDLE